MHQMSWEVLAPLALWVTKYRLLQLLKRTDSPHAFRSNLSRLTNGNTTFQILLRSQTHFTRTNTKNA